MADLSAKRELHRGAGDALSTAIELAVTPAIVSPASAGGSTTGWARRRSCLICSSCSTMGYEIWKLFVRYSAQMQDHESKVAGLARARSRA